MDASKSLKVFLFIVLVGFCDGNAVLSQQVRPGVQIRPNPSLLTPSRELVALLDEAKANIEAKQWTEATLAIGTLLGLEDAEKSEDLGVDYFLRPGRSKSRIVNGSLFAEIASMTDELPDEAYEILNVRHGVGAEQAFRKALADGDWRTLESIATKFSFLACGHDATMLLADRAVNQGDMLKAAMLYARLFDQKRAFERFGPSVAFAAASAFIQSGNEEEAKLLFAELVKRIPDGKVSWSGKSVQWKGGMIDYDSVSASIASMNATSVQRSVTQTLLTGGNTQRNASTPAGVPLPILRWHAEMHESSQHRRNLMDALKAQTSLSGENAATTIPSRVPICVGRSIVVSTYDQRIVAIDSLTGLLQWVQPYSGMPLGLSMDAVPMRLSMSQDQGVPDYLSKRVWGEAATGNLSSDGTRIFGISELPSIDVAESYALGPNARMARPLATKPYNVLQCWSVPGEGKLLWEVGGLRSEREPELTNALFLGAPLPHRGELLIMAEINGEVLLLSLTPETGKLRWKQPLISNASGTIASDVLRRNVGASPSVDGNVVFCPTLSGYLIAFDLHSRSLRWAYPYEIRLSGSSSQVGMFGGEQMGDYSPFESRTADQSPVVSNGVAIFAPIDGKGVFAVSVQSGKTLWHEYKDPANQVRYIAGIVNDCAAIVCQGNVLGLDVKTGKARWNIPLGPAQQVVGKGTRNGSKYFLPTAEPSIIELDFVTGKILDSIRLEHVPGNLIYANDKLISASPFQLDAYAIRDLVRNEVKNELESASVSTQSMLKRGELALVEGNIEEAMNLLEKVYQADPTDQECWTRLRKASTMALASDFEKYVSRVTNFNIGLEDDFVFLRMLVFGLQQRGKYEDVLLKLFEFSDARTGLRREQTSSADYFSPTDRLSIQEDRWIESQLSEALSRLPDLEKNPKLQAGLAAQIKKLESLPPNLQRVKLRHLRSSPAARNARNKLAEELLNEGRLLDAEELLVESLGSGELDELMSLDRPVALLLAKLYEIASRSDLADRILGNDQSGRAMIKDWLNQRAELNFGRVVPTETLRPVPFKDSSDWPTGKVSVTVGKANEGIASENVSVSRLRSCVGETLLGWDVSTFASDNRLILTDPRSGKQSFLQVPSLNLSVPVAEIFAVDGKLFLDSDRTIIALNALQSQSIEVEHELWHRYFESATQEVVTGRGRQREPTYWGLQLPNKNFRIVHADRLGIILINDDQLLCLDPKTGDKLWSHSGFQGGVFLVLEKSMYAILPNKQLVQLDLASGLALGSRVLEVGADFTCFPTGKHFLFADEVNKQLKLVDPVEGKVLFEKAFAKNTLIGFLHNACVMALESSGKVCYWNLLTLQESEHQVKLGDQAFGELPSDDTREKKLSLQLFGDRLLVLPYLAAYRYNAAFSVTPTEFDRSFIQVCGSVFAVSIKDGSPLWENTVPVKSFTFPMHQDRSQSPAAFFVRRILLAKANDGNMGEMACMAAIDIRNGSILYENNDVNGVTSVKSFEQKMEAEANRIKCFYCGLLFEFVWDNSNSSNEDRPQTIGFLDTTEYKKKAMLLFQKMKEREKSSVLPLR